MKTYGEVKAQIHIVAYFLKARTVETEKQLLLGNDPYTRSRGTRHACCDVTQVVLEAAFSVGPCRSPCYATVR
jgi:hypothetical protein